MRNQIGKFKDFGKKTLEYEFKCTDADEDGIFYHTPFGEIDSTEFAQFIGEMENFKTKRAEFENKFILDDNIKKIIKNTEQQYLEFYDASNSPDSDFFGFVVIFDGDVHYIYSTD